MQTLTTKLNALGYYPKKVAKSKGTLWKGVRGTRWASRSTAPPVTSAAPALDPVLAVYFELQQVQVRY